MKSGNTMLDSWLELVDRVLLPARPHLARCQNEREPYLAALSARLEGRSREIRERRARIEAARAEVFAAGDGVVSSAMTDLEREWRVLSRQDPEGDLMDLWARIAPRSWLDRKRFRDGAPGRQLDMAIALAADVEGVERAEGAIDALRVALAPWGLQIATRVAWRPFDRDFDGIPHLLERPLRASLERLAANDRKSGVLSVAQHREDAVHRAVLGRFPERVALARAIAHAAFVDCVVRAAPSAVPIDPVAPLRLLWGAGYVVSALEPECVALEVPPL